MSDKVEEMVYKHDREIGILLETQKSIANTLEEFKDIHKESTLIHKENQETLHKIQLSLTRHDMYRDEFEARLKKLEYSHDGAGCNSFKELSKRVDASLLDFNSVKDKVNKLWIYGTVAMFLLAILIDIGKSFFK